jgi:hypothetical protein
MMEFVRLAQDSVIGSLENKKFLLNRAEMSLASFRQEPYLLSSKEEAVLYQAAQHYLFAAFPEVSLSEIAKNSNVGVQTARKYTIALEEKSLAVWETLWHANQRRQWRRHKATLQEYQFAK